MKNLSRSDTYEVSKEDLENDHTINRISTSINIDTCNNLKVRGVDY